MVSRIPHYQKKYFWDVSLKNKIFNVLLVMALVLVEWY